MWRVFASVAALALASCGEAPSGFIQVQSTMFFGDGDSLSCGRLDIRPKANGFLSGFYSTAPGSCDLTYHAKGAFFGRSLCALDVKANQITQVFLTRRDGMLACTAS